MMSATPIPTHVAMSYYADLDVSVIDELRRDARRFATKLIADTRRDEVIRRDARTRACPGAKAYWVCPLIEESESLQLKTAWRPTNSVRAPFPELKWVSFMDAEKRRESGRNEWHSRRGEFNSRRNT
jgi:ATP-dependent DNA helicase RecG